MRLRTRLMALAVAVATAGTGATAAVASPGPSPSTGTMALAAAPHPNLPTSAVPGSTPERRAALARLSAAEKAQAIDQFRALVGPRLDRARAAAKSGPAGPAWRDVVAGRTSRSMAATPDAHFSTAPIPARRAAATATLTGDPDGDGLDQGFEAQLADAFTPYYHISAGERAGTGFATFLDQVPQTVAGVSAPVPPTSHYRVKPLGTATDSAGTVVGVMRLDYLTLWNSDDGFNLGGGCGAAIDLVEWILGVDIVVGGHPLDNERSAILVAAPLVGGTYNPDPNAYGAYSFFTAAHEGVSVGDNSFYYSYDPPVPANNHIELGTSLAKHGTYAFNPDNWPVIDPRLIALTYSIIDGLYFDGFIDYDSYLIYLALADEAFYDCVTESFNEQGGTYASTRTDVGEPSQPINGSGFINDANSGILDKLARPLWQEG